MTYLTGIDVSNWQGSFNWLAQRGKISFGAVQATEGTDFYDPDFAHDWEQMKAIGIARFAYHFARPAMSNARTQASRLLSVARATGLQDTDQFMLDLEVSDGLPGHEVSNWARTFCQCINNAGHRCCVYTNPSFAGAGNCSGLGPWPLWIADYGVEKPAVPAAAGWKNWTFWQHSGSTLDMDYFNGSADDLDKFMHRS